MAAPSLQTTALMTEHLGYPPVSLLDDIINCVNDILYKCTAAMEKYLLKKSVVHGHDYSEEIMIGVAQLETLLEHSVDRNFDRLELYVLRNVLRVPEELIINNVFRLRHQTNMVLANESVRKTSEVLIRNKVEEIELEFERNKVLHELLVKVRALKINVKNFKDFVTKFCVIDDPITNTIYNTVAPIDDSIKLLSKQLKQFYESSEEICSIERLREIRRQGRSQTRVMFKYPINKVNEGDTSFDNNNKQRVELPTLEITDPDLYQLNSIS